MMNGYRLQRLAAGLLAGVGCGLGVALLDVMLALPAFDLKAALAAAGLLGTSGLGLGLWLGVVLCGIHWTEPLKASLSHALEFVRIGSFHQETQKVAAVVSTLTVTACWALTAVVASHMLAAKIVRPGLEAVAITLVLGGAGAALLLVRPALCDVMEDLLDLRARVWDRHVGVVSVASLLGLGVLGLVGAGVAWRGPLYNVVYALDTGLLLAAVTAVVTLPLALVLLTVRPLAWLLEALTGAWRLLGFVLGAAALGVWAMTLPARDDVREALFDMGGASAALYALVQPADEPAPNLASTADDGPDTDTDDAPPAVDVVEAPSPDGGPVAAPGQAISHVLFVSLDTVRADRLGLYGYKKHPTSPNLDAFAANAVRFSRAYASGPCTSASFMGMVTSTIPSRLRGLKRDGDVFTIPGSARSLASRMRQAGFATRALMPVVGDYLKGIDRGFDTFDGSFHFADMMVDRAIRVMDRAHAPPRTFTWVHLIDAHFPYEPHRGFGAFGRRPEDLYAQEIAFMDAQLARLFAHLDQDGWSKDTLVVVFSDHGEAFGEHGTRLHGNSLYDEEIHIPLIMAGPGLAARDVEAPVSLMDLGPTVAALTGVAWRGAKPAGQDLVPLLNGGPALPRRVVAEGCKPGSMMALIGEEKLFYRKRSGLYFLYDLTADPQERKNIFKSHPQASTLAADVKAEMSRRN
jgi:choline-sulfatase